MGFESTGGAVPWLRRWNMFDALKRLETLEKSRGLDNWNYARVHLGDGVWDHHTDCRRGA